MPAESRDYAAKPITGEEFDAALTRAETFLRRVDASRSRINRYEAATAGTWAISGIAIGTVLAAGHLRPADVVLGVVVAALTNMILTWRIRLKAIVPLRHSVRRDERYAAEAIGLLREVLPFIARDEQWSLFRVNEAKLRISRFPIRGGKP